MSHFCMLKLMNLRNGIAPENPPSTLPSLILPKKKIIRFPHAIVIADFVPQQVDELPAKEYDLVALLHRADENWYLACTLDKEKVGYIPRKFLKVQIDTAPVPIPSLPPQIPNRRRFSNPSINSSCVDEHENVDTKEFVSRPPPRTPRESPRKKKLREYDDIFILVVETFEPDSEHAIGAK
ncbi:hypothetical protein ACTXT7_006264, partial [Hymenolepis weldensis]